MNGASWRQHPRGPVVVAVDGTKDGVRALRYGVLEAQRRGVGLRLVHVPHETIPMAPMVPMFTSEVLQDAASRLLADAVDQARELSDHELDIEYFVGNGPRTRAILEQCQNAAVAVLGPRASTLRRWFTGSTTSGVAARAACPVVCVPAEWEPAIAVGRVVVGVDGSEASQDVIDAAFALAEERKATLTVLHAWRPVGEYDVAIVRRTFAEEWRKEVDRELAELTAGPSEDHPDVEVHRLAEYQTPGVALAVASERADLLVLGRRGAGAPFGLSLGTVARVMIRAAHCPVEIIPVAAPVEEHSTQDLADAGPGPII